MEFQAAQDCHLGKAVFRSNEEVSKQHLVQKFQDSATNKEKVLSSIQFSSFKTQHQTRRRFQAAFSSAVSRLSIK
jgi:hypothetical protein